MRADGCGDRRTSCPTTCRRPTGRRRRRTRPGDLGHAVRAEHALADAAAPGRWRVTVVGVARRGHRRAPGWRPVDRGEDPAVAGAAAQVAGDRLADLEVVGRGVAVEEVVHGHDQAGRAEPALHGARHRRTPAARPTAPPGRRRALDGGDRAVAHRVGREHEARAHQHAVEQHRARPALALLAGVLGAGQAEPLAQHVEQALADPRVVDVVRSPLTSQARSSGAGSAARAPTRPLMRTLAGSPAGRAHRSRGGGSRRSSGGRRSAGPRPPPCRRTSRPSWVVERRRRRPSRSGGDPRLGVGRAQRHGADRAEAAAHACGRRGRPPARRGDRDHHGVAGADLQELLRAAQLRHPHRGDQLARLAAPCASAR